MNNNDIAILVVEFQKTWTQDSFFHFLLKKEYKSRNIYENSINLLNDAREHKVNIIQSPFIIDKNDKKIYKKIPLLPKLLGQFKANTWRAEYTDGIFKDTDYEVKGRTAFDNTVDSNLIEILKELKTKTIYIMGFTTDHCVAETTDSLLKFGYEVILIKDASATFKNKVQLKMEDKYNTIRVNELISKINKLEELILNKDFQKTA